MQNFVKTFLLLRLGSFRHCGEVSPLQLELLTFYCNIAHDGGGKNTHTHTHTSTHHCGHGLEGLAKGKSERSGRRRPSKYHGERHTHTHTCEHTHICTRTQMSIIWLSLTGTIRRNSKGRMPVSLSAQKSNYRERASERERTFTTV